MASASRLSEARRCFSLLAIVFLMVTLFGSHLPWMHVSEENKIHQWTIQEDGGETSKASFELDMYFNLLSFEACQTFKENSAFYYQGQSACSVMPFEDATKHTIDDHDWTAYTDSCQNAGTTAFVLIVISVLILLLVVVVSAFKNLQRKCCPQIYEAQHGAAKFVIPSCAALAPLCATIGILIYFLQCINTAKGLTFVKADSAEDVQRIAMGYEGFWMALAGSLCMLFWWILFTIWFCNKSVAIQDFEEDKRPIPVDSDDEDSRQALQGVHT